VLSQRAAFNAFGVEKQITLPPPLIFDPPVAQKLKMSVFFGGEFDLLPAKILGAQTGDEWGLTTFFEYNAEAQDDCYWGATPLLKLSGELALACEVIFDAGADDAGAYTRVIRNGCSDGGAGSLTIKMDGDPGAGVLIGFTTTATVGFDAGGAFRGDHGRLTRPELTRSLRHGTSLPCASQPSSRRGCRRSGSPARCSRRSAGGPSSIT